MSKEEIESMLEEVDDDGSGSHSCLLCRSTAMVLKGSQGSILVKGHVL